MNIVERLKRHKARKEAEKMGMGSFFAYQHYDKLKADFELTEDRELVKKFHDHGFYYESWKRYDDELVTKLDFENYLAEWDYYRLHPLNGPYTRWIDDKLTFQHAFSRYSKYIPDTYYHILKDGTILEYGDLPDAYRDYEDKVSSILDAVKGIGSMVWKPVAGTERQGVIIAEYIDGQFYNNGTKTTESELRELASGLHNYILQQYYKPASIYEDYFTTVRILVLHEHNEKPEIALLMAYNSDTEDRGYFNFATCFDESGKMDFTDKQGNYHTFMMPHWEEMHELVADICKHYPELVFMGIDLGMTEDGFCFFEINSNSDIQDAIPYLKPGTKTRPFFLKRLKTLDHPYSCPVADK